MNIITEPRYQDFNGDVHNTEKRCKDAEQCFKEAAFRMLKKLAIGCKNQKNCEKCPFYENNNCSIETQTGDMPINWTLKEEE